MFKCFFGKRKWFAWSWMGMIIILYGTWWQVTIDVHINEWFGEFYNLIQSALSSPGKVNSQSIYLLLAGFAKYAGTYVLIAVCLAFFTKHWTFRWRQAMSEYYLSQWEKLRLIEGASQRVQEDTKRFAILVETLGVNFIESLLTLLAFMPILWTLSESIHRVPLFGAVDHVLVYAAILFAIFGTVILSMVGWKLPGLEFQNQRVEASFRKELVYAEDDASRGEIDLLKKLYEQIRSNYFRLYFHYLYFDLVKYSYLQVTVVVPYIILVPTIVSGAITLGLMQQIVRAFQKVENSFQFLVKSWSIIVELMSVFKRLRQFESQINAKITVQRRLM